MSGTKKTPGRLAPTRTHTKNIAYPLYIRLHGLSSGGKKDMEMAYMCNYGKNQECDGCMDCRQAYGDVDEEVCEVPPYRCEACGGSAEDDGYYYDVDGVILCVDCVDKLYRKEAS